MGDRGFNHIFKNISGDLFCPACGNKFREEEMSIVTENEKGYVVSVRCTNCNLNVMMNIMAFSGVDIVGGENTKVSLITSDDVIEFSKTIRKFDGNFHRAFMRIDRNR